MIKADLVKSSMIKVGLYVRVSTDEQAKYGYSIDTQINDLKEYARSNNMEIVEIFVDEGISARKKYNKRKEFIRLLECVKQGRIEMILFTKLDRWFRNVAEYYKVQEILEKYNVNWKTIYEDYDTSTANGRLKINIMLSVAQDEADRTSERIKVVFKNKITNKQVVTGSQPYAYRIVDKELQVIEENAIIVKDIFNKYDICRSVYATQRYINLKYNINFGYDFYADTLKTKKYTGYFRGIEDYYPQIIDKELFESCQVKRNSFVRENQTKRIYLFSGLVKCSECDRLMNGLQTVTTANKFLAYRCKYAVCMHTCKHNISIREDFIENYLFDNLPSLHAEFVADCKKKKQVKKSYQIDIDSIKKKLKKLKELYVNDLISIEEYRKDYDEYMSLLKEYEIEKNKTVEIEKNETLDTFIRSDMRTLYDKLTRENKRSFWRKILKEIVLDNDNKIKVNF